MPLNELKFPIALKKLQVTNMPYFQLNLKKKLSLR